MDSLINATSGKYWITTYSGTRYLIDLDNDTAIRFPIEGHEWTGRLGITSDGKPFHFVTINGARVGESMYLTSLGGEWRLTSEIQSIELYEEDNGDKY